MDAWQILIGVGAVLTPAVLAAFARDRSLVSMIEQRGQSLDDRINRTRDEFVRRDDLAEHLQRLDKQFDAMRSDIRLLSDEIRRSMGRSGAG